MQNGLFISIEGGEGVGKTTQMRLLRERLPEIFPGREFLFTREPGGSPFAERVRDLILSDAAKEADGETMFGLFMAARADHLRRVISPHLAQGKVVISDRFAAASFAYQAVAQENPIDRAFFVEYYCNLQERPRLTLILDMDTEVAQARIQTRRADDVTHFDVRGPEFHRSIRSGYVEMQHLSLPETEFVLIDAAGSVEEVHAEIISHLTAVL